MDRDVSALFASEDHPAVSAVVVTRRAATISAVASFGRSTRLRRHFVPDGVIEPQARAALAERVADSFASKP